MQPPIIAALIALIGAALIVPFVKMFVFDARRGLRLTVESFKYKLIPSVKTHIDEAIASPQCNHREALRRIKRADGYARLSIMNPGRKTIAGVNITIQGAFSDLMLQIGDDENMIFVEKDRPVSIGNILPAHKTVVHIWSDIDSFGLNMALDKKFLRVSADEFDYIKINFPLPPYLLHGYGGLLIKVVQIICFTVAAAAFLVTLYKLATR